MKMKIKINDENSSLIQIFYFTKTSIVHAFLHLFYFSLITWELEKQQQEGDGSPTDIRTCTGTFGDDRSHTQYKPYYTKIKINKNLKKNIKIKYKTWEYVPQKNKFIGFLILIII